MKVMEYGEFDVTEDRNQYIGGSDLSAIMGLSPFKTRYHLLLEKAGLEDRSFQGNKYTEYGHIIEPQIRDYINKEYNHSFLPNRVIDGDFRYHSDGHEFGCVLEVKSTSSIHQTVDEYMLYLVQLVKGMEENEEENGILAVYDRPEDLDPVFTPKRLQIFPITMADYLPLLQQVNEEIDRFRLDLERLKNNPLLTEEDFIPDSTALLQIASDVVKFENQLAMLKEIEAQCKEAKKQLYKEMQKHGVKSWTSPGGAKITMVEEIPATTKTVTEFDAEAFKVSHPRLYKQFANEVEKKVPGKSGFVRITLPKG